MSRPAQAETHEALQGAEPESGVHHLERRAKDEHQPPDDWRPRKGQVLTSAAPSTALSITRAMVLKDENVYFVTDEDGSIPFEGDHGFGLYYQDCRFLNGYSIELEGAVPELLTSTPQFRYKGIFELTNPDLRMHDGRHLSRNELALRRERIVDGSSRAVHETLVLRNYSSIDAMFDVKIGFRAEFEDIFEVRGLLPKARGNIHPPAWHENELELVYLGRDGLFRTTAIRFSRPPDIEDGAFACFRVHLPPGGSEILTAEIQLSVSRNERRQRGGKVDIEAVKRQLREETASFREHSAYVETENRLFNQVFERSVADLLLLRTTLDDADYYAAGVPWFVTLFGRDSLITALEMLPYHAGIAEDTLRLLARYQGTEEQPWRDEQPGKILHEMRIGELSRLDEIPHTPYYGSVDATALFLILIARHAAWTGRLDVFSDLRPNIDAAFQWLSHFGERSGIDGYVAYDSETKDRLVNQGWKDSGDAIVDRDGQIVNPPVALVEVQAYTYLAKTSMANIFERAGDRAMAEQLRREARELKKRFNRDFWSPDRKHYVLALAGSGQHVAVQSSNPGHALWAGIADEEKARQTVEWFMSEEMFSGWGVRTLAADEKGYNPISYHRGTVWPHDNAIILAGFRRYGFDREACRIFEGILSAAANFPLYRLPEVWSGFPRAEYGVPVRYPVACHPQAWAAGSLPFMLAALLGFEVDGFDRCVRIRRPVLPPSLNRIEVRDISVGSDRVSLEFHRTSEGTTEVRVLEMQGDVTIDIQDAGL